MALAASTEPHVAAGLKVLENDFAYFLETKGVSERVRGFFGHLGVRRTAIFARLAANDEKFRDMLVKRLGPMKPHRWRTRFK